MPSLSGQRVLVTGGAGFLGAALCARLAAEDCRVAATSRRPQPTGPAGVAWYCSALADEGQARALLAEVRPDVVYHLAGDVSAVPAAERVLPTFNSLLGSAVYLLLAALQEGKPRVILAGSLTEPDDEPGPQTPSSPYSAAKWAASGYARMFAQLYDLPAVVMRLFMTYGPGQKPEKIVPYVVRSCLRGEAPRLSSGRQRADWIYVDDVVEGLVRAATATNVAGATIDLGSGLLVSTREVAETAAALVGPNVKPQFGALPDRPFERDRFATLEPARRLLGWEPRTSLRDGLRLTVEGVRRAEAVTPGDRTIRALP